MDSYDKIIKKLDKLEDNQDKILWEIKNSKGNAKITKIEAAEAFFKNSGLDQVLISKAPDLIYPSIYSDRSRAVSAIKALQKKGLFNAKGNFLVLKQ